MDKIANLFDYFRQCPALAGLWSIAATENIGARVIIPQGASPARQYREFIDNAGIYNCEIVPYPSVYEDYQINCYEWYDENDTNPPHYNKNVLSYNEVRGICDWIREQDEIGIFPDIGENIVSVECNPFVPQIRYINQAETTVGYFITVRIRYVNRRNPRTVEYEL